MKKHGCRIPDAHSEVEASRVVEIGQKISEIVDRYPNEAIFSLEAIAVIARKRLIENLEARRRREFRMRTLRIRLLVSETRARAAQAGKQLVAVEGPTELPIDRLAEVHWG